MLATSIGSLTVTAATTSEPANGTIESSSAQEMTLQGMTINIGGNTFNTMNVDLNQYVFNLGNLIDPAFTFESPLGDDNSIVSDFAITVSSNVTEATYEYRGQTGTVTITDGIGKIPVSELVRKEAPLSLGTFKHVLGDNGDGTITMVLSDGEGNKTNASLAFQNSNILKTIEFKDANLEENIKAYLGVQIVSGADLDELRYFHAYERGIIDLSGLENAKNLEGLDLRRNSISDLTPLENLSNLTSLVLAENSFADVKSVSKLSKLIYLDLSDNPQLTDISSLSTLTNLETIVLVNTGVQDISPLTGLTNLKEVVLYGLNLDVSEDSETYEVIQALESRGVQVSYDKDVEEDNSNPDSESYLTLNDVVVTHHSITVNWEAVGPFDQFDLFLNDNHIQTVSGDTSEFVFENLQQYTNYDVRIEGSVDEYHMNSTGRYVQTLWNPEELKEVAINVKNQKQESIDYGYSFFIKGIDDANKDYEVSGNISEGHLYTWTEESNETNPKLPVGSYRVVLHDWSDISRAASFEIKIEKDGDYVKNPINLTLDESKLVSQPFEMEVTNVTDTSFELKWPDMNNIDGYQIGYYVTSNGYSTEYTQVEIEPGTTSYTVTDLTPGSRTYIDIKVKYSNGLTYYAYKTVKTTGGEVTGEIVQFADEHLEEVIREELGIYAADIWSSDLEELTSLSAYELGISDLSGLEFAINLSYLNLYNNDIDNIEPLRHLKSLESLSIWNNYIDDLTPLSDLENLRYIDLDQNLVENISPLLDLKNLETVSLYRNPLTNTEVVEELRAKGIVVNYDDDNGGYPEDYVFISVEEPVINENSSTVEWSIHNNESEVDHYELYQYGIKVEDYDGTSTSYSFADLVANNTYYFDIKAILVDGSEVWGYGYFNTYAKNDVQANVINLPESYKGNLDYYISGRSNSNYHIHDWGKVTKSGSLKNSAGLTTFKLPAGLYEVQIYDPYGNKEPRYYMIGVQHDVDYTKHPIELDYDRKATSVEIKDKNLEAAIRNSLGMEEDRELNSLDLERLTYLDGAEYGIKDLTGLEYAVNLSGLYLYDNDIENISVLEKLPFVTSLTLWDNNISDISVLSKLPFLEYLDLDSNNISDVSPLSNITSLKSVWLSGNPATDISSLKTLTSLDDIYFYDMPINFENTKSMEAIEILQKAGVYVGYDGAPEPPALYAYVNTVTDTTISLEWWMENGDQIDHFNLYQGEKLIKTFSPEESTYTVDSLKPNSYYEFTVEAVDTNGEVFDSIYLDAKTQHAPEQMKNVKLQIVDSESLAISKSLEYSIQGTGEDNQDVFQYGYSDSEGFLRSWYTPGQALSLPVGEYEVIVYANGIYQDTIAEIEVKEDGDYEQKPIQIKVDQLQEETKSVTVKVTDENGEPIKSIDYLSLYSNGVVNAFNYKLGDYYLWNQKSDNGEYTIDDVLVSDTYTYQLSVRSNGYITSNSTNIIVNSDTEVIDITLNKGAKITGNVVDVNGNPLTANYFVYGNQTYEYGQTNGQELNIGGLTVEDVTVEINMTGFQSQTVEITADQFENNQVDIGTITLQSEKYVHGKVFNADQKPASNVYVYLYEKGSRWITYSAKTDANGYFKIRNVEDGSYRLTTDSYNLPDVELTDIKPQLDEYTIVLEEEGEGSFVGEGNGLTASKQTVVPGKELDYRLNYKNNGEATAENVKVSLELSEDVSLFPQSILVNGTEVQLDRNGNIVIPSVAAGESGTITFKTEVSIEASETLISSATISFDGNEVTHTATSKVLFVTLNAPEVTASQTVKVYGNAKPGATVGIYDGDVLLAETTVDTKWWFADVSLPIVSGEKSTHSLVAKVTEGERSTYSQPVTVKYEPNIPKVTDVKISAGWNQNISVNPNVGVVTTAIVEYTPIEINVQFDKEVDSASIQFLGEDFSLEKNGDKYTTTIPGTWSSYGEQMMELTFTLGEESITLPLMEVIVLIDPSGYVFEGSMENRLQGVTAIVEEERPEGWKQWNAAFFGQVNPQVTDEDGRYGWDVIQGNWRVIFSKDGYDTYTSRIVTVPPAETQLNVPLIRKTKPVVDSVTPAINAEDVLLESTVTIEFDRLMNEQNITNSIKVLKDGQAVEGTFTLEGMKGYKETQGKPGYFEEDATKKLSQTVVWTPDNDLESNTTYMVVIGSDIQDYVGKTLENNVEYTFTTGDAPVQQPGDEDESDNQDGEDSEDQNETPDQPGDGNSGNEGDQGSDNQDEPGEKNGNKGENNSGNQGKPGNNTGNQGENPGKENSSKPETEKPSVKDQDDKGNDDKKLPVTAGTMYNMLFIGLLVLVAGLTLVMIKRRKQA